MFLKRNIPIAVLAVTFALTAAADSAHFVKGPFGGINTTNGEYTVTFKEAGLGSTPVTYTLTAVSETFTFQCFTKSRNTPQGAPNGQTFSNVSTSTTLQPRNGQVTGSISLIPQEGAASCQGNGLQLCLIGASYTTPSLTDGLGNTVLFKDASASFPDNPIASVI
jgi:hypothetical protein